jgi:hypothetical protein
MEGDMRLADRNEPPLVGLQKQVSLLDDDAVRGCAHSRIRNALPGLELESKAMPRACDDSVLYLAESKGASLVRTAVLNGAKCSVTADDGDLFLIERNELCALRRHFGGLANPYKRAHGLPPFPGNLFHRAVVPGIKAIGLRVNEAAAPALASFHVGVELPYGIELLGDKSLHAQFSGVQRSLGQAVSTLWAKPE